MGTFPHRLTVQKLPGLPTRIISLDVHPQVTVLRHDARRSIHTLYGGALVCTDYIKGIETSRRQYGFCTSLESLSLIRRLMRPRSITWLVSHNLSYDLTLCGFWKWVDAGSVILTHFTLDDPPAVFHGSIDGHLFCCVDLLNYWRKPLGEIANSLGMSLPDEEGRSISKSAAAELSLSHAHVVARACSQLSGFMAATLGGGWKATAAGIAWSAFRSRKWGDRIRVHNDHDVTDLERASYYGGLCKAHYKGKWNGSVTAVDVNNLYGSEMSRNYFPTKLLRMPCSTPMAARRLLADGFAVCASVRLEPGAGAYPYRERGRVQYHGSGGITSLAGPDLVAALEQGIVREVLRSSVYESGRPFQRFVDYFYSERVKQATQGNKGAAALCKLITSSVYGRLAMAGTYWEPYSVVPPKRYCVWYESDPDRDGQYCMCRSVAGSAQRERTQGESANSFPAIAAYVTAYARQRMNSLRRTAGDDAVLYEDTDCLHVTQSGLDRLTEAGEIDPMLLGKLKVVAQSNWAQYWGEKSYAMDGVEVHAGLSSQARRVADGLYLQDKKAGISTLPSLGPRDWVEVWSEQYHVD